MLLVAFVALDPDSSPPTPADVASAWQQTWPEEAPLAEVQGDDGALTLSFMDAFGMVGYIPQPLPWSDLEGPARCAWHWPEAVDILEQHAGHVIVSVRTTDESSIRNSSLRALRPVTVHVIASQEHGDVGLFRPGVAAVRPGVLTATRTRVGPAAGRIASPGVRTDIAAASACLTASRIGLAATRGGRTATRARDCAARTVAIRRIRCWRSAARASGNEGKDDPCSTVVPILSLVRSVRSIRRLL